MVSLTDLPDIAFLKVLTKCDLQSTCTLRKVCWDIRNFIDEAKPFEELKNKVIVTVHENMIELMIHSLRISYQKHDKGCLVVVPRKSQLPSGLEGFALAILRAVQSPPSSTVPEKERSKLLEGSDFVDVAWTDLKLILEMQSTEQNFGFLINYTDPSCDVRIDEVADRLFENFENNNKIFIVDHASFKIRKEEQLLRILRFFNPRQLLLFNDGPHLNTKIDADKLIRFDFWSNLEGLDVNFFVLCNVDIRKFLHIPKAVIHVEHVTSDDLRKLKETLIISPKFKKLIIRYETFLDESKISEKIGKSDIEGEREWSFDIPGSNEKLVIKLELYHPMYYNCICVLRK